VGVPSPTPDRFRGLARSSPWRWRALAFDLHRRPLPGPEHTVHAVVERGVGLEVQLGPDHRYRDASVRAGTGWSRSGDHRPGIRKLPFAWELPVEVDRDGFVVRRPAEPTSEDPMWQDYLWVAMLDPVELADGSRRDAGAGWAPDAASPPALDVHRLHATLRHGRATWWAEVSPRPEYSPRCSCCPLLLGRVSDELEALGGARTAVQRRPDLVYATSYLVALDVQTGVCVHVEHLDGDDVGRGFSLEIRSAEGARS
jgi:hypothetical protein